MTLGRRSVLVVLAALYVAAVWARFASVGGPEYPYHKGESGTNFRNFHEIADRGTIASVDVQASWPEGLFPFPRQADRRRSISRGSRIVSFVRSAMFLKRSF